ncbi:MAG TPA: MFS transporter [Spirochaetia bacterium]|nr:MFS transporter [Spirochaetia bacterium]
MDQSSTSSANGSATRLPRRIKLGFGVCDLGGNLFFTFIGFFLLIFLTDTLKLNPALAGTALMIGKLWDAVTDPAVGYMSDRTRSRWGRRKPYMVVGAVSMLILMAVMFVNPHIANQGVLFVWVVVFFCLLSTAYTLVNIPYGALTPELTSDFNERTVLNGYRMTFAVVGTLIGAAAVLPLIGLFGGGDRGWTLTGGTMGVIIMVTALITVAVVPEKKLGPQEGNAGIREVLRAYREVLSRKTFLTALFPWALHIGGVTIIQASLLYYFEHIYGNRGAFNIALLILLLSTMAFIPVWVAISKRIGKRASYNTGMLVLAGIMLVFFFLGPRLGVTFAYLIMLIGGFGLSTHYVMPWAILPDVVEYDYAESGLRREGVFYGMWTFVSKVGQALAIAVSGWILAAFGYHAPLANGTAVVQSAGAKLGIRLLAGPIPAIFFIAGVIILSYYPITAQVYAQILEKVRRRDQGAQ